MLKIKIKTSLFIFSGLGYLVGCSNRHGTQQSITASNLDPEQYMKQLDDGDPSSKEESGLAQKVKDKDLYKAIWYPDLKTFNEIANKVVFKTTINDPTSFNPLHLAVLRHTRLLSNNGREAEAAKKELMQIIPLLVKTLITQQKVLSVDQKKKRRLHTALEFELGNVLSLAVLENNEDVIKVLADNSLNLDLLDNQRRTPLYNAVLSNKVKLAELLVERGANPHFIYIDDAGNQYSPILTAKLNKNLAMLKSLGLPSKELMEYALPNFGMNKISKALSPNSADIIKTSTDLPDIGILAWLVYDKSKPKRVLSFFQWLIKPDSKKRPSDLQLNNYVNKPGIFKRSKDGKAIKMTLAETVIQNMLEKAAKHHKKSVQELQESDTENYIKSHPAPALSILLTSIMELGAKISPNQKQAN